MSEKITPEITPSDSPKVATLEEIRRMVQERLNPDLSKLPTHSHAIIGTVRISLLSNEGYDSVEAADVLPDEADKWSPKECLKFRNDNRFRAYVKFGVYTGDGKRLPDDLIEALLIGDCGAENKKLLDAIQEQNPPRETLVLRFQTAIAVSRLSLVLYRLLREAGCLQQMRDYFLAGEGEEKQALAEDLQKWEAALLPFEALMEADEAARAFDIGVYERKKSM